MGLNYIASGKIYNISGNEYTTVSDKKHRLNYIASGQVHELGLTTDSTASKYSPLRIKVENSTYYIGRSQSSSTSVNTTYNRYIGIGSYTDSFNNTFSYYYGKYYGIYTTEDYRVIGGRSHLLSSKTRWFMYNIESSNSNFPSTTSFINRYDYGGGDMNKGVDIEKFNGDLVDVSPTEKTGKVQTIITQTYDRYTTYKSSYSSSTSSHNFV